MIPFLRSVPRSAVAPDAARANGRRMLFAALLAVAVSATLSAGTTHAQTITFKKNGQVVNSWKLGEQITVEIKGGGANAKLVQIHWQNGNAGAWPNVFYSAAYNPAVGLKYTFTANFPTAVSITAQVKFGAGANQWITMNTLWRRQ